MPRSLEHIVTIGDVGAVDLRILRVLQVDAVGVGAVGGRADADVAHRDAQTAVELEVRLRAVPDPQILHRDVAAPVESHRLINSVTTL